MQFNFATFGEDSLVLLESTLVPVLSALLGAYVQRVSGVPGAPPITLQHVGQIAGGVAALTVLQNLQAAAQNLPEQGKLNLPDPFSLSNAQAPSGIAQAATLQSSNGPQNPLITRENTRQ